MKKKTIYGLLTLVIVSLGVYIALTYSVGETGGEIQKVQKNKKSDYVVSSEELSRAAKSIGEIKDEQTLNHKMMEMSFQKITFDGDNFKVPNVHNPGRVQVTKENIQYLKNNLNVVNDEERIEYESILNEWYNGNFKSVVEHFKKLRYLLWEDKSVLAPVKKTNSDEKEYILHFFGQDGLDIHNKEWK
ncbi:DUF6241 domain-containing protein [Bacillus toyonensis]|uniref:DUF6241 domain-containing protein n=1 Tax=Bacillus toyonensis TaxID=155322 RepID=UPI003465AD7B